MRWFYSKAAALILIWSLNACTAMWSIEELIRPLYSGLSEDESKLFAVCSAIPIVVLFLSIPLSGWLADSRFGNFKVFKVGCILLFLGAVAACVSVLVVENVDDSHSFVISAAIVPVANVLVFAGGGSSIVASLQLGLDQMPDACSDNITSYIAWYFITVIAGSWISNASFQVLTKCTDAVTSGIQIWSLFPVVCSCIVVCSFFILGTKWLTIEPQSPQSLKNIFRVLKFAAKHKAPINRSALTYWEENIPSRMDLGKSRYGGPFTTEQVEDVKTFFRLLVVFLPVWMTLFSINVHGSIYLLENAIDIPELQNSSCVYSLFSVFTYSPWWCVVVTLLLYEVAIYPFIKKHLPSILQRIGMILFLVSLLNLAYFILALVYFIHPSTQVSVWPNIVYIILSFSALALISNYTIEFSCAQSPYSMRGLLSGFSLFTLLLFAFLGYLVSLFLTHLCYSKYCSLSQYTVAAVFGIAGFLLHCVLAHWYKWRVRDEDYNPYPHVEAIYDRYLSAVQRNS